MNGRILRFLFALPVALVATAGLYYFWFSSLVNQKCDGCGGDRTRVAEAPSGLPVWVEETRIKIAEDALQQPPASRGVISEVKPDFPKHCPANFRSGQAVVEFDVSPEGEVMNARVLSSTDTCLNSAALKNVSKFHYPPATDETGRAVWRRGVRETLVFELTD